MLKLMFSFCLLTRDVTKITFQALDFHKNIFTFLGKSSPNIKKVMRRPCSYTPTQSHWTSGSTVCFLLKGGSGLRPGDAPTLLELRSPISDVL
jgi:hypothetical protein